VTAMKHIARLCVLLWLGLLAGQAVVHAAEATADERNQQPEVATPAATESPAGETPAGEAPAGEAPDVFVPTEEISEDFAVSFPVDI
jgi:hypothetical protein